MYGHREFCGLSIPADITVNSTCNTSLTLPTVTADRFNKVWTITAPGGSATTYNTDAAASAALTNSPCMAISVVLISWKQPAVSIDKCCSSATACDPVSFCKY
ncbi:MAG: hypothetical protein IPL08_10470 [Saprospiraceae bacterium]|nr:hypothetical protein [Saprospiraceae bacterium]